MKKSSLLALAVLALSAAPGKGIGQQLYPGQIVLDNPVLDPCSNEGSSLVTYMMSQTVYQTLYHIADNDGWGAVGGTTPYQYCLKVEYNNVVPNNSSTAVTTYPSNPVFAYWYSWGGGTGASNGRPSPSHLSAVLQSLFPPPPVPGGPLPTGQPAYFDPSSERFVIALREQQLLQGYHPSITVSIWRNTGVNDSEVVYTEDITANTPNTFSTGVWNHRTLQPDFTQVAQGNGNIGIDRNWRHIYFVGSNNHIYNAVYNNNNTTACIYDLDFHFSNAAPGGIDVNSNSHYLRFIGTDGRVYNAFYANNQWNIAALDWNFTKAAPGAIGFDEAWNHVYFIGVDNHVYNAVWAGPNNPGTWYTWDLNNTFGGAAPGAIDVNSTDHYVRFIGTDGRVYNAVYTGGQWNMWALDWNFTNAAPGAIAYDDGWKHVYFIGNDHRLYNAVWDNNNGVWNTWALNNNFYGAAFGALRVDPQSHNVFFTGTDGRPYNAVYSGGQWNIWALDWNNTHVTSGGLGYVENIPTGNNAHDDIYVFRNEAGQLDTYVWADCGRSGEGRTPESDGTGNDGQAGRQMPDPGTRSRKMASSQDGADELTVYPNPMVDATTVSYVVSEAGDVSIGIYSLTGVLVKKLVSETNGAAGHYEVTLDKGSLAAGMYYVSLKTGAATKVIKLIVR